MQATEDIQCRRSSWLPSGAFLSNITFLYLFWGGQVFDLDTAKKKLRVTAEKERGLIDSKSAVAAGHSIAERFFDSWSPTLGSVISAFWPFRGEIDIRPLMRALCNRGYTVALPGTVSIGKPLLFREWDSQSHLEMGAYGIPSPSPEAALVSPDWLLTPLLAFDVSGYRLGYGGGFYDITICNLAKKKKIYAIGVAYDSQEITSVPRNDKDQRLDAILTEKRTIIIGK